MTFELYCDYLFSGWESAAGGPGCGGIWGVSGAGCTSFDPCAGGDPTDGTITACGIYTAPLVRPPAAPGIAATECPSFGCFDACGAGLTLSLDGDDVAPP